MRAWIFIFLLTGLQACATYYQANYSFNAEFEQGQLDRALKTLQSHPAEGKGKTAFLYDANNGLILSMQSQYKESNDYLEKAFLFGEDYRINYLNEVASYLTNPTFTVYKGEDHEHLMVPYYKALNYLKLGNMEDALVECRRLNIRLQQLSDRYTSSNKYRRDAFVHTLMGIIYDASQDYNNAFIAYRNAWEIYQEDYARLFNLQAPQQLKLDLLRTAWLSGLQEEFQQWKAKLDMSDYVYRPATGGELVFFWHNGLAPVKTEWSINFVVQRRQNHLVFFNEQLGISFPFDLNGYDDRQKHGLSNLEFFRVAFPRYLERPVLFQQAMLSNGAERYPLQTLEDVNKIAFKCLEERMLVELSKALLRAALKKVEEMEVRKNNEALGSLLGAFNAITEKADTRNWQTLPHTISYARVPLVEGENDLTFQMTTARGQSHASTFHYTVKKGQTLFHTFTSLESGYPTY